MKRANQKNQQDEKYPMNLDTNSLIYRMNEMSDMKKYFREVSQDRIKAFRLKTISNVCFALAILLIAPAFALVPEFQSDPDYPKDYCEILFGAIIGLIVTGLVVNVSVKFKLSKIDVDQASVVTCGTGNGGGQTLDRSQSPN